MKWIQERIAQYQLWRQQRREVSLYDGVYVHREEPELMDVREDVEPPYEPEQRNMYARHRSNRPVNIYHEVADGWGFDPLEGVPIGSLAHVAWEYPHDLAEWDQVSWPATLNEYDDEGADA